MGSHQISLAEKEDRGQHAQPSPAAAVLGPRVSRLPSNDFKNARGC